RLELPVMDEILKAKRQQAGAASRAITIRGAREHNLKNIDVEIPRDRLVVFTGLSGSGKSSLAFDTIYAEGQRRYVESLSGGARPQGRIPQGARRVSQEGIPARQDRRHVLRTGRGTAARQEIPARHRRGGRPHRGASRHRPAAGGKR